MTVAPEAPVLEPPPGPEVRFEYVATARQRVAHASYADEMLYGGAAGGGKSRFVRAEVMAFALEVPGSASIVFRRSFPDLSRAGGMIPGFLLEMPKGLGVYNATDHRWTLRNGSTIELAHLSRDADVTKYQGAEYQLIVLDEATHFTEYQYRYLMTRLRASGAVRDRLKAKRLRPRIVLTANPGGVGHGWVKGRFVDPAPPEVTWRPRATLEDPKPGTRVFIPARVTDNPHIDETYIDRLNNLDEAERRALRDGDWDVYQGQRFASWRRSIHVVDPEQLPLTLGGVTRGVGVDYGLDAPFAALWGAKLADGLVYVYRELYKPGLTPAEQAALIRESEAEGERTIGRRVPVALDPSTWARNPHHVASAPASQTAANRDENRPPEGSIAAAYRDELGAAVVPARNDRLASVALIADKLRVRPDGLPRLLVSSTCVNLIRTLPALPRDPKRPEDVDTKAEDHAYDALRYLVMLLEGTTEYRGGTNVQTAQAQQAAAELRATTASLGTGSSWT